jgi:predicted transcriptional regulator
MGMETLGVKEKLDVFVALDNTTRFNMLIFLSNRKTASHKEIAQEFKLSEEEYCRHVNKLFEADLVKNGPYRTDQETMSIKILPTEKAQIVLDALLRKS